MSHTCRSAAAPAARVLSMQIPPDFCGACNAAGWAVPCCAGVIATLSEHGQTRQYRYSRVTLVVTCCPRPETIPWNNRDAAAA